jgi:hypothetical protein
MLAFVIERGGVTVMSAALCFLFPPVILMYIRDKILGDRIKCNFHGSAMDFLREYLLSACFLNFTVLAVNYLLLHHNDSVEALISRYTSFTVHYLLLSFAIAAAEPALEYFIRYHVRVELHAVRIHVRTDLLLYAYSFVLVLMNLIRIFDHAFWGDEGFTIRLAKMSVGEMISATGADVHPPLYYLLAQLLYHLLGDKGYTWHLTALLPYIVIVILGCTVIRKTFGTVPAAVMITMSSLMKKAVMHNVEVRMYALAAMFILIAYIAYYKIIEHNRPGSWILFCISSLGAAYTHYYALISVAFLYVMLIPLTVKEKQYRKGLLISALTAILSYLPWLMILVHSFERTANYWWVGDIPGIYACFQFLLDYRWLIVSSLFVFWYLSCTRRIG